MIDGQESLSKFWLRARSGTMNALEQSRAWALREVWIEQNIGGGVARGELTRKQLYGMQEFVRQRVFIVGDDKSHPCANSIKALFAKIDSDPEWFPGKRNPDAAVPGPAPILQGSKRKAVADAAMGLKRRGIEPTYPKIVAQCPTSILNPSTGKAVRPDRVYKVLSEDCYDESREFPWRHQSRVAKKALTDDAMTRRLNWGVHMRTTNQSSKWCYQNIIWTDICNSVIARTIRKENEMALARKSGKGWISDDQKYANANLKGDKNALKLSGSETERIYWVPILTRGKLHVEIMPPGFPGETEAGAAILVQKVRVALNVRFQNAIAPKLVFVDRGNGFYVQVTGEMTPTYAAALKEHGLKNFMGSNCGLQPGQIGDVLLHETAVGWIRRRERSNVPARAWEESYGEFSKRLKDIVRGVNLEYDVEGLCRELPMRLQKLVDNQGGKLKK
jgi:hypothetical protein